MNEVLEDLKGEIREPEKQETLDGFSQEDGKLTVIADDRENSVAKELSKMEVTVRKKRLEVADFLVSDRTVVERKRAEDFVDSLVDERLFSQLPELQQFENPVLIIEGEDLYSHRDVHPNSIRGALSSIAIDHKIPIIWTSDEKDTYEMLKTLAKREQEDQNRTVAIRGSKGARTEKELQEFVVAGLPDVNTKLAERLLERFGSIEKIFTVEAEELKQVEGIGEKTANQIRSLIEKEYDE